ncbi:MAG: C1 family peptidase [Henriciella sp.]|nr:C1 family peptidase [Henriciella sp.]
MRFHTRVAIAAISAWVICFGDAVQAQAQQPSTGLSFVDEDRYRGIPLASNPYGAAELPARIDLSSNMPRPGNQGNQNSCVGWAVAYALKSYQEQVEEGWSLNSNGQPNQSRIFSPSFIYNQINNGADAGSHFVDAFNVLSSQGAAPLSAMPYSNPLAPIPDTARAAAKPYRIDTWRRVNTQDTRELKAQLNANYPVIIGAIVDDGFIGMGRDAIWDGQIGNQQSGHAMVVVGYDDDKSAFKIINSWGRSWGTDGYGWISYRHFPRVVREAYVAKDARNANRPITPPVDPQPDPTDPVDPFVPPLPSSADAVLIANPPQHNQMDPNWGFGMVLTGLVTIPAGEYGQANVVVTITDSYGNPVMSLSPQYAMPNGQAATGTGPLQLQGQPVQQLQWYAFLPYCTLNIPKGQMCLPQPIGPLVTSNLIANPTLFVNDFGVAIGQPQPFFVRL